MKVQIFGLIVSVMVDVKVFIGCISSSGHSQQFFLGEGKGILRVKYVKNGRELGKTYIETLVSERVIKALQKWEWVWTEELLYKMGFNSLQNLKIALFSFPFFFGLFCKSFRIEPDHLWSFFWKVNGSLKGGSL